MRQTGGWFSFAWRGLSSTEDEKLRKEGWFRAWHGCKFEATYSIMYHEQIFESLESTAGRAAVYCHKDGTSHKVDHYARHVALCNDGVFWSAKWELRVDRTKKRQDRSDQWLQRPEGVRLAALWICGKAAKDMHDKAKAQLWQPDLEANPMTILDCLQEDDITAAATATAAPAAATATATPETTNILDVLLEGDADSISPATATAAPAAATATATAAATAPAAPKPPSFPPPDHMLKRQSLSRSRSRSGSRAATAKAAAAAHRPAPAAAAPAPAAPAAAKYMWVVTF